MLRSLPGGRCGSSLRRAVPVGPATSRQTPATSSTEHRDGGRCWVPQREGSAHTDLYTQAYVNDATQFRTRDRVMRVAAEDYGGVSADEALSRLLDEHWQARCIGAVASYRAQDPENWAKYLRDADQSDAASAPITEPWNEMHDGAVEPWPVVDGPRSHGRSRAGRPTAGHRGLFAFPPRADRHRADKRPASDDAGTSRLAASGPHRHPGAARRLRDHRAGPYGVACTPRRVRPRVASPGGPDRCGPVSSLADARPVGADCSPHHHSQK
jgi:hypothetical protein